MHAFPVPARFLFAYWIFPLCMLFFHIISIYVYGLMPAQNKGMHAFVLRWHKAVDMDGDYVEK
jgi:hypothetical protein